MTGRVYQNILVMDHILPVCEASCSILDAEKPNKSHHSDSNLPEINICNNNSKIPLQVVL